MLPIEEILLASAVLLLTGIVASKASARLGIPALLLFLLIGMLAGSEGPGGIPFDDPVRAQSLGVIALAFILFAGGLETDGRGLRSVLWQGLSLATIGVLVTAALVGWFARIALGFTWTEGLLLGAIVSSTDAAAVFSVLRSQSIGLKGSTSALLEFESGSNDAMAVFLTMGMVRLAMAPAESPLALIPMFLMQMTVGAAMGYAMGRVTVALINRLRLQSEGLYPVFTLAMVLLTYAGTSLIRGNGFLAVYLAGIVIGNSDFIHKRSLVRFHDGLSWLMQIAMFLTLGLLVFPSRLAPVAGVALLTALFLIVVARPVAVMVSLAVARLRFRQKALISWVGLRGAVPIILATFPMIAGTPKAETYFNVVFFIVITSVLLQGTSIALVARMLRLDVPASARRQYPLEFVPTTKTKSEMVEVTVPDGSPMIGKRIMDLRLPKSALVTLIGREDDFIAPRGGTELRRGDTMLVLVEKKDRAALQAVVTESLRSSSRGSV